MTRPPLLRPLAAAALAALAAACAAVPEPALTPMARPTAPATPPASTAEHLRRAVEHLGQGRSDLARVELSPILVADPSHTTARKLMDQIDRDPRSLLGVRNYPYKIRPGETLSALAERFLGDPLMFYALARYNDIAAPDSAEVGRVLKIPGFPKAPPPPARAAPARRRAEAVRPASPAQPAPPPAAPGPPVPTAGAAGTDPARAGRIRRAALEALNRGSVDQAVLLLRQAMPLDPANPAIRSDLARAERIQATVKNR